MNEGDEGRPAASASQPSVLRYLDLADARPSAVLAVAGGAMGILAPILLFFFADDVLEISHIFALFLITGGSMLAVSMYRYRAWNKSYESARDIVVTESGIHPPITSNWKRHVGTLALIAGYVLGDYDPLLFFLGILVCLGFAFFQEREKQRTRTSHEDLFRGMLQP